MQEVEQRMEQLPRDAETLMSRKDAKAQRSEKMKAAEHTGDTENNLSTGYA
jgi:hypothetical protein